MENVTEAGQDTLLEPAIAALQEDFALGGDRAGAVILREVLEDGSELSHLELGSAQEEEEQTPPWAEGACLFDMTQEEWRLVRSAPLLSFILVASVDGQVSRRERRALVCALEDGKRSTCEVFRAVCRELFSKREELTAQLLAAPGGIEQIPEAYQVVARNLGREEAERFKWCLLEVGRRVAVASGGLFASWGWLRREERHALAELAVVLDSSRS
jgi:cyanophycinase-like exopeptidase